MQIIERMKDIVVLINDIPTYEIERVTGENNKHRTIIWGRKGDRKVISRIEYKKPDYSLLEIEKIVLIDKKYDNCPNCSIGKPLDTDKKFIQNEKVPMALIAVGAISVISLFAVVINKWWNKN